MERSLLLQLTGDLPLFRIVDFLVENKGMDFTKKGIAEGADISRASLFNYWKAVEQHGIVRATRKFGKTTLYTLNTQSPIVRKILDLEKVLIAETMEREHQRKVEGKRILAAA